MNNLLIQIISITVVLKSCEAVPVSRFFGEKSTALFGVLTCILVSAVIGMCVFCKKKKGQFQKFENDGNIEEIKNTEYPIIKSLGSLEANRTCAIIPSSPTNLSTDNLLEETVQYQNESVSSQELDVTENYNLAHYQKCPNNENDSQVNKKSEQDKQKHLMLIKNDCECSSNMLLSSKESLNTASVFLATKTSSSVKQEISSLKYSAELCDTNASAISAEVGIEENGLHQVDIKVQHLVNETISIDETVSYYEMSPPTNVTLKQTQEDVTPLDSLEDNSSSHETNSIEEALRALDFAINGEQESPESEDERNFVDYLGIINENRIDAIHNEFYNEKHSSSDSGMEEAETSEKNVSLNISQEAVREEASRFVDEILLLCQNRVAEIKECEKRNSFEKTVYENEFNDFNKHVLLESSTPFVPKKSCHVIRNVIPRQLTLFDTKNNETYIDNDNLRQGTEKKEQRGDISDYVQTLNVTYQIDSNTTLLHGKNLGQTFPMEETSKLSAENTSNYLSNSSETVIKNHSDDLPAITIDSMVDESNNPTATPMNTPIELGYPTTEDWDEWLSTSNTSVVRHRDFHAREEDDYFSSQTIDEGWFLHAQSEYDKTNGDTFDFEENDNLDSTYDLLRKQITEMLSTAQHAKELPECFEENDTYTNEHGMQYGGNMRDETANALAKDNELIINYKRALSPIIEESEDESFHNKASFYKESSNYVESTSTGCRESLTAMGINRTLMASNDTLFNFEDMLDEILSPRVLSQSHTPINRDRDIHDYFLRSPRHDLTSELSRKVDSLQFSSGIGINSQQPQDTLLSSPGDPLYVDHSQSSSFNLEEETCVFMHRPSEDNERISEISEPVLVSSTSCQNKQDENSFVNSEISSIESFNEILEKEKPIDNEQYIHVLNLHGTESPVPSIEPPERDENFDPFTNNTDTGQNVVYFCNKLNQENTFSNCSQEAQGAIESIDRFLLKSRNMGLPEDKSTNSLVNGHLNSCKVSSRSGGKNVSVNNDK